MDMSAKQIKVVGHIRVRSVSGRPGGRFLSPSEVAVAASPVGFRRRRSRLEVEHRKDAGGGMGVADTHPAARSSVCYLPLMLKA
jgi:hypothetical protein